MRLKKFLQNYDIAIQSEHEDCENPGLVFSITNKKNGIVNTASWWTSDPMTVMFGTNFDNPRQYQTLNARFTEPIIEYTVALQKFRNNKEFWIICNDLMKNL
jgi:hypothetical protein